MIPKVQYLEELVAVVKQYSIGFRHEFLDQNESFVDSLLSKDSVGQLVPIDMTYFTFVFQKKGFFVLGFWYKEYQYLYWVPLVLESMKHGVSKPSAMTIAFTREIKKCINK